MGQTKYYSLSFFDFGDRLDARINVQKEIDRFVVIDKQMYGLYRVFGNGVIDDWNVRDAGFQEGKGISIAIDTGMGVINYLACETSMPGYLYGIPPNSLVDIYVSVSGAMSVDRTVSFIYSPTDIRGDDNIKIARVSTGSNSILYIDNTIRDLIGFDEIIQDAIDAHKHRGTPSKIDLSTETRNQLPGARIECIDCHKLGKEAKATAKLAHARHEGNVSCHGCHSQGEYQNCYNCHIEKGSTSRLGFILGVNPEDKKTLTTLRAIPVARETFLSTGIKMENFDEAPDYRATSVHNIQKSTERTRSCDTCHIQRKGFLLKGSLMKNGSKANESLIFRMRPLNIQ